MRDGTQLATFVAIAQEWLRHRAIEKEAIMVRTSHRLIATGVRIVVAFGIVPVALAQPAQGTRPARPMYDTKAETRVTGTVATVERITGPGGGGRMMGGGIHLTLKTATESIEVHLGPASFLTEKNLNVAEGDTLAILGSRVTIGDKSVLLAREVTKGEKTVALRDESGRPLWRRGPS
jgi:hypothetical protein